MVSRAVLWQKSTTEVHNPKAVDIIMSRNSDNTNAILMVQLRVPESDEPITLMTAPYGEDAKDFKDRVNSFLIHSDAPSFSTKLTRWQFTAIRNLIKTVKRYS